MRIYFCAGIMLLLVSCNTKTETKTVNEVMDDTARMRNPPNVIPAGPSFNVAEASKADIPKELKYKGKFQEAWKWTDLSGENLFFTSLVAPYRDGDKGEHGDDGKRAELYAYHYIKTDAGYHLAWELMDGELSCPLDITTEFISKSTTITDLDKDGYAETKIQFALACRGDVSPATMKLILQENMNVYTLEGNRWIKYGPESKFDITTENMNLEKLPASDDGEDALLRSYGRYESERSFASAPPAFLVYARNEWLKYAIEEIN